MTAGSIRVERDGPVVLVTIDRPEKRNAIDPQTSSALNAAFVEFEGDPAVRVVVLTGAGDVFCAGADLRAIAEGRLKEIIDVQPGGFGGLVRLQRRKVVIAAVNGHALAGGFELVLASDLAVASEDAEFALPETTRGIIPGAGGLVRLPRQISPKLALELVLTGARLNAQQALELGLVNRVTPRERVVAEALDLAHAVCRSAPVAVSAARMVVEAAVNDGAEAGWRANEAAWAEVLASEDAREGARAFAEKRPPQWQGAGP